ncbi:sigma-70 family RNA polymerase sigma factor, partial [Patescibacteria group bacterium]
MNPEKFRKFYETHFNKIYRFVLFRVGNRELAEDLVSEIFVKALKAFPSYDESRSRSSWIFTIARNHLINHYRSSG